MLTSDPTPFRAQLPDTYASFVDATAAEEHCAAVRLLILASKGGTLHGVKQLGSGEVPYEKWRETIKASLRICVADRGERALTLFLCANSSV